MWPVMSTRDEWSTAHQALLDNARRVSEGNAEEISRWSGLVTFEDSGRQLALPAYVPYVGANYFKKRRWGRILVYAMSQNIKPADAWALEWARDWADGNGVAALDRQNDWFKSRGRIAMHPFDTGHGPVLAAILRGLLGGSRGQNISTEVAATNLCKFSFRTRKGRTTDKQAAHEWCWKHTALAELEVLQPTHIICMGNMVHRVVSRGVREMQGPQPAVLKVAFPGGSVLNAQYSKGASDEELLPLLSTEELDWKVYPPKCDPDRRLRDVLRVRAYYFLCMKERLEEQLA